MIVPYHMVRLEIQRPLRTLVNGLHLDLGRFGGTRLQ